MKPWLKRALPYAAVVIATASATLFVVRARAAGIPDAEVLTYTGYLEDGNGAPLIGDHSIAVRFWEADTGGDAICSAELATAELVSGRFQVPLPATCAEAVQANPNLFVDVAVDGASLGRTKLGAVPYALEAGHATAADVASAAAGDLQSALDDAAATSEYVADRLGPNPAAAVDSRWGILHAAAVGACMALAPAAGGNPTGVYIQEAGKTCTEQCAAKATGTCRANVAVSGVTNTRGTPGGLIGQNYLYSCDNAVAGLREGGNYNPDSAGIFSYCCCGDP